MCHSERQKFKSSFGEPPVFEKKKQFDATTPRKRKPVSFFDPTRDRINKDSEDEQLSPRTDEKPVQDNDEDDRAQEVTENINIETS